MAKRKKSSTLRSKISKMTGRQKRGMFAALQK
jgi:hypothetical protein